MNTRARTHRAGRRPLSLLAAIVGAVVLAAGPGITDATAQALPAEPVGGALLGSHGVIRPEGTDVPVLPHVQAASYVVTDLDNGKVLAAKDPHGRHAPASTIKVLTALATLPYLEPQQRVQPTLDDMSVDGTKVGVDRRRTYSVHCLYQAMLMMSANDAASAVARAGGGSGGQLKTVARMNALTKQLHAGDTYARKPTGLDAKGQTSSAYDLSLIFRAAMQRKDFRGYTSTRQAQFPDLKKNKTFQISSHNHLLAQYPGTLGGKNGFTTKAEASFVGEAKRGGHTIGIAVMRTPGTSLWADSKKLLSWGFSARSGAVPVGDLVAPVQKHRAASASPTADTTEKDQAVTPMNDDGGLPPWLPPLGLAAAVILCALVAGMALFGRRNQAPSRSRRRGAATAGASRHAPSRGPSRNRRGHGRRAHSRRAAPARASGPMETGVTASYPIWPND